MISKKTENKPRKVANISSIAMVLFLSVSFIFETRINDIVINYSNVGLIMAAALFMVIAVINNSINHYKLAFTVPLVLFIYNTLLMILCNWHSSHYLLICLALCAISCTYSSFSRTLIYIVVQNLAIGFMVFRGIPIAGHGVSIFVVSINWVICLFSSFFMLLITRSATVVLSKAVEHQQSFRELLDTTENFVAMIDESNKVVYASRTLSQLGNIKEAALVQGRPLIDLFPGRSLKIHAGKMLKEKDNYAEDWEFSLDGQKRYFKTISQSLRESGGTLISMYDMTYLAERDEIAALKDSMKVGLFFMDSNYIIQDHYSRYLEELLSEEKLFGRLFTDVISDSVTASELDAIKDYFNMVFESSLDPDMLEDINPLTELHYVNARTGDMRVFQCTFSTIERGRGELFILVTVYDITARVELQKQLAEEQAKRQEEMEAVFELLKVEPDVFSDFMDDMEHEFDTIEKTLKSDSMSARDILVKVYQSIHAVKSNAVILGLSIFGNKLHKLESKIKKMREITGDIPFAEMLNLTMDVEKLTRDKEGFKDITERLQSYGGGSGGGGDKQNVKVLIESLAKTTAKASEDMEKQIRFVANDSDIDSEAIQIGPRRVIKEILMQLVRNSVVHGIEAPDVRKAKGKNETGTIKLSIKMTEDKKQIHIKMNDDGKGLDYERISEKAIMNKIIRKEDADNKDMLLKAIFAPGFSTAENEDGIHGGRGIGLNLVRDRLKEVHGTIKLRSETDKGIVFFVAIPVLKQNQGK